MRPLFRRKLDMVLIAGATIVIAVIASIASAVGDSERVATIWIDAELTSDGSLAVSEVIDYDFGVNSRRGIFRDVDDLDSESAISVDSPTAPDEFVVFDTSFGASDRARIRIGDPDITISGRHRYNITFELPNIETAGTLAWDAVGVDWAVSLQQVEILLRSDHELINVECVTGPAGSWDPCATEDLGPGTVAVAISGLDARHGVSLFAQTGGPVPLVSGDTFLPIGPADDPGLRTAVIAAVAVLAALAAAVPAARIIRRMGRERVHTGGAVAAAFGGSLDGVELVDLADLSEMATTAFAPPEAISATHAGVIFTERVPQSALSAWLVERAINEEIEIHGEGKNITLTRGPNEADDLWRPTINKMFGTRQEIDLSKYDKKFTAGWTHLQKTLEKWRVSSDFWDDEGRVMQVRVRAISAAGGIAGAALVALGGAASARWGGAWPILLVAGALLAGGAAASMVRSWELLVRSAAGSAAWVQIESFRRFLEGSEASHVENAAQAGRLREYTAWAISLGETRAWSKAAAKAVRTSPELSNNFARDFYIVSAAHHLTAAAGRGSTAPSSSGGGGGGSFSGGGGGGGGGGSW